MNNIKEINGNLLEFPENIDILCHGCSTLNIMGGGIAKQIKEQFPEAYEADTNAAKHKENRLGYFSGCKVTSKEFDSPKYIINLYIQDEIGTDSRKLNYEALYSGLEKLKKVLDSKEKMFTLGFPEIGCGLAGGDFHVVKAMIESVFRNQKNYQIIIVKYSNEVH